MIVTSFWHSVQISSPAGAISSQIGHLLGKIKSHILFSPMLSFLAARRHPFANLSHPVSVTYFAGAFSKVFLNFLLSFFQNSFCFSSFLFVDIFIGFLPVRATG